MNPFENTLPEEKLQKKTRLKSFTIMQHLFPNIEVVMLASHSTGCSDEGEGRGAEQAGPARALHLQSQYSESSTDRHAVPMSLQLQCIMSTILRLGLF